MLYVFLSVAAISIAAWDMYRRQLALGRARLEHDKTLMSDWAEKLPSLIESHRLQRVALENFLKQTAEMLAYSQEKKRALEMQLAGKKL